MPWFEGWGPTSEENWRGTLSIPRKLSLDMDGNLRLYPVRELNEIMKLDGLMEKLENIKKQGYVETIRLQDLLYKSEFRY